MFRAGVAAARAAAGLAHLGGGGPGKTGRRRCGRWRSVIQAALPARPGGGAGGSRPLGGVVRAALAGVRLAFSPARHAAHPGAQRAGGEIREIGALAPTPGSQCCLSAYALCARRKGHGPGQTDWTAGVALQVVAVWRRAEEEAWLLVTDLPATLARCREYRRRTWEEELFRDLKGMGWQWQQSRVRRPERVARLVLVLALATLWMLALAQRVVRRGWRPLVEARSRRECSVFQRGLRYLRRCLANDRPVPVAWSLFPVTWPP